MESKGPGFFEGGPIVFGRLPQVSRHSLFDGVTVSPSVFSTRPSKENPATDRPTQPFPI